MDMIIRRPLALVFLAYMLGIGSNYIFSPTKYLYLMGVFIFCIASLTSFALQSKKVLTLILTVMVVFNTGGLACQSELEKKDVLWNKWGTEATYWGTGIKYQKKEKDFHKLTVKNGSYNYLINIYGEGIKATDLIGSRIEFTGNVEKPPSRRNPGCFDYEMYLKSVNIRSVITCYSEDIFIIKPGFRNEPLGWIYATLASTKYGFLEKTGKYMSSESHALMNGMLFGSKDDMDEEIYEAFQRNGIAHILSVSGIHVGIVYAFIFMLMGKRINIITSCIILIFLFVYAFLSEFSPSVMRAVIMISIHITARLIRRPYDLLTGTSAAALFMLILNPLTLFHVGFQLSFLAVFLLAFYIPFLKRYIGRRKIVGVFKERFKNKDSRLISDSISLAGRKVTSGLMPLIIIQIGMAPFTMFVFNYFSFAGLFINIPVILIAGILIPVGICIIFLSIINIGPVSEFLFITGTRLADVGFSSIIKINERVSSLDFNAMTVVSPLPWLLVLFYGLLFFLSSETFRILRNRKMKIIWISSIVTIMVVSLFCSQFKIMNRDDSDIVFVDVGQGDCIHISTPSGKNILIDGGGNADYKVGEKILLPYLLKNGIKKLDHVFVTHLHTDHYKGIREVSNHIEVENLITYDGNRIRQDETVEGSGIQKNDLIFMGKGERYIIEKDIYIEVLYPDKKDESEYKEMLAAEEDENSNSLFMKLYYKNISILITGDLDEVGENRIMGETDHPEISLKSTILKVGHHGSKYSTSDVFLDYVDPQIAVIQVGKNNYGHPAGQVIEKLENKGIMIYRNDTDGAVLLKYRDGRITLKRMIDGL